MPMRPRNWKSCSSGMLSIRSPKTVMVPESGRINPFASLSSTLLPLPAGPSRILVSPGDTVSEIFSSTGLPSKPMETSSKITTGCDGSSCVAGRAVWGAVTIRSEAEDVDHELADQKVDEDDEHGRNNHRLGGGAAHSLRTAACGHAIEAPDTGNDEAKHHGLYQALKNVGKTQRLVCGMKVLRPVLSQHHHRYERPAQRAYGVGDDGEEKEHENRGVQPGRHQFLERICTERTHGINLLGHHHGAQLAGHSRRIPPGHHEAGENRAEFLDHRKTDQLPSYGGGAKLSQRGCGLQGQYPTGKEAGEDDDRQ